jgi:transposase
MDRYIGLDVHAQTTTIVVMSPKGKHLSERVVETHGKTLVEAITGVGGMVHVCLEEGMHSEWVHEILLGRVAQVVVMVPPERTGPKSDARDAWWLADQLRLGVPQRRVYKSTISRLHEAVRAYDALTKHATRAKLQLRFLARGRGLKVTRAQLMKAEDRDELLQQLPPARAARAELHARLVDVTEELRQQALEQLSQEARKNPDVQRLMGIPGVGPIRASQIVATVITPHRFRTREQFWSYSGFGVLTRVSAEWEPKSNGKMARKGRILTRGLTPGNPTLKAAFKGAAKDVVRHYPKHPWAIAHQRALDEGKRVSHARLTLARKIAETLLCIWKRKEAYDPTKHKTQTQDAA